MLSALSQIQRTVPSLSQGVVVDVSIIIPAFNEAKVIGRCLESLAQMDFPRDRFEVIVADNGSTDTTLQIAESFRSRIHLQTFQSAGVHISALRNLGAHHAYGTILAFLDADCVAPRTWLASMIQLLPERGSGTAGAYYLLPPDSSWVGRVWHEYQEAPKSGSVSHVPAGDLAMRREDYRLVGGFDETIQTNEDYELCERVRAAGMPVRAVSAMSVVHLGTAQSLRAFYQKQRWHGTHVLKVFLRNVLGSRNRKAVLFAFGTLLFAGLFLGGALWSLYGGPLLIPFAGLMALLLVPAALSVWRIARRGRWIDFFPLAALYLIYGLARAEALLHVRNLR